MSSKRLKSTVKWLIPPLLAVAGLAWLHWQPLAPGVRLRLTTIDGNVIQVPGPQLTLLNFWATTCPACLKEIPTLIRLHRRFSGVQLQVVGVTMPYDRPDRVVRLARDYPLPYPVALDPAGTAADSLGVRFTPTWVLVDREGKVVWRHTGYVDEAELAALIESLSHP